MLGALLVQAALFRAPTTLWVPLGIFVVLTGLLAVLKRLSPPALGGLAVAFLLVCVVLPRAFEAVILSRVSATYALDVDHRLWPDGKEINSDSARFKGEAEDLADEDFVVLFAGDSFTFGFSLAYEDSYPYVVESLAASDPSCRAHVRAVNMGWTSASPLLALRLLRQVAYKYRPDLIVYSLDVTDFHDDLRYERRLREEGDYDFDAAAIAERWLLRQWPGLAGVWSLASPVTTRLRGVDRQAEQQLLEGLSVPAAGERFFVTARPLSETRPAIEAGVRKNLDQIAALSREVLGSEMALVLYPRAYQYSDREVPRNWETGYTPLGPYVREPFRYFEEAADDLPYPVIDIYSAFEASEIFPLYFGNDPHWTENGSRVAAEAVFDALVRSGLLPCDGPSAAEDSPGRG